MAAIENLQLLKENGVKVGGRIHRSWNLVRTWIIDVLNLNPRIGEEILLRFLKKIQDGGQMAE